MNSAVIYKQLDDYRSRKRLWGVMSAIATALTDQDSADVAAYFAGRADGLPPVAGEGVPDSAPPRVKRAYGDPQISLGLLDSQAIRHRVNAKEKIALRDLGVLSNW